MAVQHSEVVARKTRYGQTHMEDVGQQRQGPHAGGIKQKYVLDERGRALLLREYDGTPATITRLTHLIGVPRWKITRWAADLGLARQKEPRWTEAERAYLEQAINSTSIAHIAQHLGRTQTAVRVKMKRIHINKSEDDYTMRRLCDCLGCNHHMVQRWLDKGWLKGTRRHSDRTEANGGDMWLFTDKHVRDFICHHPQEIDQRRVGWLWVVDLLCGGLGELS